MTPGCGTSILCSAYGVDACLLVFVSQITTASHLCRQGEIPRLKSTESCGYLGLISLIALIARARRAAVGRRRRNKKERKKSRTLFDGRRWAGGIVIWSDASTMV